MYVDLPNSYLYQKHPSEEKQYIEMISPSEQNNDSFPIAGDQNNDFGGRFFRFQSLVTQSGTVSASEYTINNQTYSQPYVHYIYIPRDAPALEDQVNLQLENVKLSEEAEYRAE